MAAPLTEYEKMISGELFRTGDPATDARHRAARARLAAYNATPADDFAARSAILKSAFTAFGSALIRSPVTWEYGHITMGTACFFNYDCMFLDSAPIAIGNYVAVGPRTIFTTANHPLLWSERALRDADGNLLHGAMVAASPIVVEDHVWIGAAVTVLPGVTIGARSTIGAGAVVTRSIPPDVLAAGNPCRVIRPLSSEDVAERVLP